jgi:hypothetical protein
MMSGPFHAGELAVQQQAGVAAMASRIGNGIHDTIPPAAASFLAERNWVVLAIADARGRPWASVVGGPAGFAAVAPTSDGRSEVRLATRPAPGDPLTANLSPPGHVGLLAIDLRTRRRMRVNGRLVGSSEDTIVLLADQVYSNCPKYIQRRVAGPPADEETFTAPPRRATELSSAQREWIGQADTFFVGTTRPGEGADASHRGGAPGFVAVTGARIRWPDYPGNMMFNTLGNIESSGVAGLLFPDFTSGKMLQVTGRARIDWSARSEPASERAVELEVEEVVELTGILPEPLTLLDYSPYLPRTEQ